MPGEFFSQDPISARNLDLLAEEAGGIAQRRICELAAVADRMVKQVKILSGDGMDLCSCLSLVADLIPDSTQEPSNVPNGDPAFPLPRSIPGIPADRALFDRVALCELLLEKLNAAPLPLSESVFLPEEKSGGTVCYLRNPLSDEAFDVFSLQIPNARVQYADSLREACARVAEGKCGYCILPLEEGGSRLASVAALLYRFDLKINEVTPVFGYGGDADMKYALVAKGFRTPKVHPNDDRYLELRLRFDPLSSSELTDLLTAASRFGYSVYRINTLSIPAQEGEVSVCSLVFRDEGKDFLPLLIYLSLFLPDHTPVGIYRNLE